MLYMSFAALTVVLLALALNFLAKSTILDWPEG